MIRDDFFVETNGIWSSYTSVMLLGVTSGQVIDALEAIDPDMEVANGYEDEDKGVVGFDVFGLFPDDIIYDLTKALHCIGYADTSWDAHYITVAKNGDDYDDYTADWDTNGRGDVMHFDRGDGYWDAFVVLTDNSTGVEFYTGAGAVDKEDEEYYANIVYSH